MYECPVCHHVGLTAEPYERWPPPPDAALSPPYEDVLGTPSCEVCPRCGFEFGNDENPGTGQSHLFRDYRREWEAEGRPLRPAHGSVLRDRLASVLLLGRPAPSGQDSTPLEISPAEARELLAKDLLEVVDSAVVPFPRERGRTIAVRLQCGSRYVE